MEGRVLGLVVAGNLESPLAPLGAPDDVALLPFAGRYRVADFALATLLNSGVSDVHWCVPRWVTTLQPQRGRAPSGIPARSVLPLPATAQGAGRLYRMLAGLAAARPLTRALQTDTIVALSADHVLHLDLRPCLEFHRAERAAVTLVAVPVPLAEAQGHLVLRNSSAWGCDGFVLAWSGDLIVQAAALPLLEDVMSPSAARDDAAALGALEASCQLRTFDPFDRGSGGVRAYWHEPSTLDGYYVAQMELCTTRPGLDLYDPAWPVEPSASPPGSGPAKVVTCRAGRPGHVVDSLVSDGAVICGGAVIKSVVGPNVLVDSGAEVEDCLLLEGCRIGRGARIRRAIVGTGVTIADGEEIGYAARPTAPAHVLRSGLTVVPPSAGSLPAAAAI